MSNISRELPIYVDNNSGFTGLEPDPANPGDLTALTRSEQPFYFPVRFIEPIQGNEAAIDFDLYSLASRAETIEAALTNWRPTIRRG
jgi:CHASE1-domain containing sensor protein